MKPRKAEYGDKNICGANIERIRKRLGMKQTTLVSRMQLLGADINPSSLSKLEGQTRSATDIELKAISKILGVSVEELLTEKDTNKPSSVVLQIPRFRELSTKPGIAALIFCTPFGTCSKKNNICSVISLSATYIFVFSAKSQGLSQKITATV